jgi:hypothetical protein
LVFGLIERKRENCVEDRLPLGVAFLKSLVYTLSKE